jgi:hypothetical protein
VSPAFLINIWAMNPDEDVEDPARKETQEFDPELLDEEGTHPEPAQEAGFISLEQEQVEREAEGKPLKSESWHQFKTP